MNNITSEQMDKLVELYNEGRLGGVPKDDPAKLSSKEADLLIALAENVAPFTFVPITDEVRSQLLSLREMGIINFHREELKFMTMEIAFGYLWCAGRHELRHRTPATRMQCQRIRHMIIKGFLAYRPNWEICFLDKDEADELIREGELKITLMLKK